MHELLRRCEFQAQSWAACSAVVRETWKWDKDPSRCNRLCAGQHQIKQSIEAIRAVQAYKGKGQEYRLFWPSRPEFVRMAARYGATIVPFAGVGAEDGFNMLLDSQEIRRLPVVGSMLEERSRREVPRARR